MDSPLWDWIFWWYISCLKLKVRAGKVWKFVRYSVKCRLTGVMFTANLFRQIKWSSSRPTAKIKELLSNKSFLISAVFRSFVIISCQLVNTTSKLVKMSAPETLKLIHFQTFHFYQSHSANRLHKSISLILLFLKTVSYGYAWFNISNHSSFWTFCAQ